MTWKERFVQFSRKAHCFTFLERIYGQCGDFDNFDAHKRDLAKTCCVWPETSVWYNFHGKRTVWPFWREFQASVTNWQLWCSKMRFGQNVLRMTYNFHEKRTVCARMTWKERLYNFHEKRTVFPFWEFGTSVTIWEVWRSPICFAKTCCAWPEKSVLYNFHEKRTLFPFWHEKRILRTLTVLAKTCCAWPETSVLYNFHGKRTVFPFWRKFTASVTILRTLTLKNGFGQNVTWKERFVQFSWKAHCFSVLTRLWGEFFDSKKWFGQNVLRMTWKSVFMYNFHEVKRTVLAVLKPRISGQCDEFEENLGQCDDFDAQKCDLAKTCCARPEKSVLSNFHGKRTVFPFWRDFEASFTILRTLTVKNAVWPNCAAHDPKKRVLYNFHEKRTVFPFWRDFEVSVTILTTLTLTNLIWRKRAAHDLKRAFGTIFMESALFGRFEENFRPVWRIDNFDAQKCDLAKPCCAWPTIFMKSALFSRFEKNLGQV